MTPEFGWSVSVDGFAFEVHAYYDGDGFHMLEFYDSQDVPAKRLDSTLSRLSRAKETIRSYFQKLYPGAEIVIKELR